MQNNSRLYGVNQMPFDLVCPLVLAICDFRFVRAMLTVEGILPICGHSPPYNSTPNLFNQPCSFLPGPFISLDNIVKVWLFNDYMTLHCLPDHVGNIHKA